MRALIFALIVLMSQQVASAQEAPRIQCTETHAFGLQFGEPVTAHDVQRALQTYTDFSDMPINDGMSNPELYRVTAVARYERQQQAEFAAMSLMFGDYVSEQFSDGLIDAETLENAVTFYSRDTELNEGVALQVTRENATLIVSCTDLGRRALALATR